MMEIIINSRIHGMKKVIIDDEDYEIIKGYTWAVHCVRKNGDLYCQTMIRRKGKRQCLHMHRLIMGEPKGFCVDHKNRDTLDNRKSNLRICTNKENVRNHRKRVSSKTSKYKGVSFQRREGKYKAEIVVNYKTIVLGYYIIEADAAQAYNKAAKKYFGEYASINEEV